MLTHILSEHEEEVDDMLRLSCELGPQHRILCSHTHGTGVQVTLAHHRTAHDDQGSGTETEFIRSQKSSHDHIEARPQLTIRLQDDPRRVNAISDSPKGELAIGVPSVGLLHDESSWDVSRVGVRADNMLGQRRQR